MGADSSSLYSNWQPTSAGLVFGLAAATMNHVKSQNNCIIMIALLTVADPGANGHQWLIQGQWGSVADPGATGHQWLIQGQWGSVANPGTTGHSGWSRATG